MKSKPDRYISNKKETKDNVLFQLTFRTTGFLMLLLFVMLIFYITGSFQQFLDSTQEFILLLCTIVSIAILIFSGAGIIECILIGFLLQKKRYGFYFFLYLIIAAIVVAVLFILRTVSFLSQGIS